MPSSESAQDNTGSASAFELPTPLPGLSPTLTTLHPADDAADNDTDASLPFRSSSSAIEAITGRSIAVTPLASLGSTYDDATVCAAPEQDQATSLPLDTPACARSAGATIAAGSGSTGDEPSKQPQSAADVATEKTTDTSLLDTLSTSSGFNETVTGISSAVTPTSPAYDGATDGAATEPDHATSHELDTPAPALTAGAPPMDASVESAGGEPPMQPQPAPPGQFSVICDLKPSIADRWVLIGQVVSRQPVRQWSNVCGSGQLLSFLIGDKTGATIKATILNEGVAMFDSVIQNDAVCSFTGGKVKIPNRSFSSAAHELTLDHRSTIAALPQDDGATFSITSVGTTVRGIGTLRSDDFVLVIGIIIQVDPARSITTAKGKPSFKREFLLVDDSMSKIICAVWGSQAQAGLDRYLSTPVLIERATINDYRGARSINVGVRASVHFDPSLPEASRLLSWFSSGRDAGDFVSPP